MHHLTYDSLGNETRYDVVPLCKGCHLKIHRGKLKIWVFTQKEYEAFEKIKYIVCDAYAVYMYVLKDLEDK